MMPTLIPADAGSFANVESAVTEPSHFCPLMLPDRSSTTMMSSVFWLASDSDSAQVSTPPEPPLLVGSKGEPPVPPSFPALPPLAPDPPWPVVPLLLDGSPKPLVASSSSVDALQPAQAESPTINASAGGTKSF